MVRENFQIYGVQVTGYFHSKKIKKLNLDIFIHASSPQLLVIIPWTGGNYSFPQSAFLQKVVPSAESRRRGGGKYEQ